MGSASRAISSAVDIPVCVAWYDRGVQRLTVFAILFGAATAAADDAASVDRHAQLQSDLGLEVIQGCARRGSPGETLRGIYIAPYLRVHRVGGDHDDMHGTGVGFSSGALVGSAFGLGPQTSSRTPFIALDILLGYRL